MKAGVLLWVCVAASSVAAEPLQMIVMDPLALQLSCTCVNGTGQRRYDLLARHFEQALGREVNVTFDESLVLALQRTHHADLIIGKDAMVRADAAKAGVAVRSIAALTNAAGGTGLRGVFLVRSDSPARKLDDLAGKTIAIGPVEDQESHGAAKDALRDARVKWRDSGSMDDAALALADGECAAAVVSEHLPVLLEGCGKLEKGATRSVGFTSPVPFVRAFVTDAVEPALQSKLADALLRVSASAVLLAALESKSGFAAEAEDDWPDWRGPGRRGVVAHLPEKLSDPLVRRWSAPLTGPPMAGVAVAVGFVVVADKSADGTRDIVRCLDATNGSERWHFDYEARDTLEYTNAPRATPVIRDGLVYVQGALGHLHCLELSSGKVVWRSHVFDDFKAERLNWGASTAPLVVDDKLIVTPGAKDAAVVALDRKTGTVVWKTAGNPAAYSAFISANGWIVGYDAGGLGAWEPRTGRRLWELVPPDGSDFNVTTPVVVGDQLLLATENNGTRLYRMEKDGIDTKPVAKNNDLAPDTCTPAVVGDRIFGTAYGELFCVDLRGGLKTLWRKQDDMFHDHCALIASEDRLLAWTADGDLLLIDARAPVYRLLSRVRPFAEKHPDSLAHPAIAGGCIYLRTAKELACFELK